MRKLLKVIYLKLPLFFKRNILNLYEEYFRYRTLRKEANSASKNKIKFSKKNKKRILIYHLSALNFAGTERNLQIIAEGLHQDYEVFVLHATDMTKPNRGYETEKYADIINFKYENIEKKYPYYINHMDPDMKTVLQELDIDLLITAGSGKVEHPIITTLSIPIIMINIFGAPLVQKNVAKIIFISQEVLKHSEKYVGSDIRNLVMYIPISTTESKESVLNIREKLNIPSENFVFGRIGRDSDSIFDEIGIRAFQMAKKENNKLSYLIVSPPPILRKIVAEEKITDVHFIETTADQKEIWSFMYNIDALAHFRFDGETQGVNISEAMYASKPIISHKSHIWNAHLEYLNDSFSRVAEKGDIKKYKDYMIEFYNIKNNSPETWREMCLSSKTQAEVFFNKEKYIRSIKKVVADVI